MRLPIVTTLILVAISILIDWYIYNCISKRVERRKKFWQKFYLAVSIILNAGMIVFIALPRRNGSDSQLLVISWAFFTYLSFFFPKLIFTIIDLLASLPKLFKLRRIKMITYIGVAGAIAAFLLILWGARINRFKMDIKDMTVELPHLPAQFEGYRIVQISDLHVGTCGSNKKYLEKVVEKINSLNPDLIVFTGDIVNRRSSELRPLVSTLAKLHAKDGAYSILGKHDYGDYSDWKSQQLKEENLESLNKMQ